MPTPGAAVPPAVATHAQRRIDTRPDGAYRTRPRTRQCDRGLASRRFWLQLDIIRSLIVTLPCTSHGWHGRTGVWENPVDYTLGIYINCAQSGASLPRAGAHVRAVGPRCLPAPSSNDHFSTSGSTIGAQCTCAPGPVACGGDDDPRRPAAGV
eukprot:SAG31_NODE_7526_length_1665_cov_3.363346_1_plen_153_part_00